MSLPEAMPFLRTDGTDWHDSPIRDCRVECPVCKYIGGPLQPHRVHPRGGWERLDDWGMDRVAVWVPPALAAMPTEGES